MNREPTRLLLATSDLDGGGAERQFSLLARRLPRRRFDVHLSFWRSVFRYPYPHDLPVHMVPKSRPWHVLSAVRGTIRLIDELRPQVIFSQPHYVNMVLGTALAFSRHQPRWVCRQVNDPRYEIKGPFARWARWALRRADRVIAPSEGVRRELVRYLHIPDVRTCRIDNLVDVDAIERACEEPLPIEKRPATFTVIHAGRLTRQKNQALLLDAFRSLRGRRAELWMLGQGPLRRELEERAAELGIAGQVRWLGFQDNPFPFLKAADVLALSSDYEGLPNVVIESMICGTPVVSTRCPYGPDELIDDPRTGRLVAVGDSEALGSALQSLSQDAPLVLKMGAVARRAAITRFRCDPPGASYEKLFESLVAESKDA